ncbi:xanthine dehydrogenase accessory protein XdhC [Roseibium alexandrii]|uniref:Xanthine dehydrogenase accessory protein XdhC n=1 Tax=Roseibium alexandrii (strain DSM 17067 / NCIMB 14079 / DFL-11) TaxID=244592 RepID=A0A5E8GZ96_ROSAD|nr:xanthine dehydrogenase accessory protein XdhC [Roseibium alexandrii]EEE45096.1 xanthine dehydrogenase accessory protein XdhC [Roseibium alexandrii DFL-11]
MNALSANVAAFFDAESAIIRVEVTEVRGSSPREAGTEMFVAPTRVRGTIGGGRLEQIAIDRGRAMLETRQLCDTLDVPLGPEIGQCCGGHVRLRLIWMSWSDRHDAIRRLQAEEAAQQHVYIMGAGHVGRAIADLLQHAPVICVLVDMRQEELGKCEAKVEKRLRALPEVDVFNAPPNSAFIVLTHDHGLDFLLTSAALELGHAAYVGMIGSATKRAKLRSWCRTHCDGLTIDQLICPIGATASRDKRPEIIAAFVAAEVLTALTTVQLVSDSGEEAALLEAAQ